MIVSDPARVDLGPVLGMDAAAPLTRELLGLRGRDVEISAEAVQRVGGQCLQVLLAAASTWARDGAAFEVSSPSPEWLDGLRLLGVGSIDGAGLRA